MFVFLVDAQELNRNCLSAKGSFKFLDSGVAASCHDIATEHREVLDEYVRDAYEMAFEAVDAIKIFKKAADQAPKRSKIATIQDNAKHRIYATAAKNMWGFEWSFKDQWIIFKESEMKRLEKPLGMPSNIE